MRAGPIGKHAPSRAWWRKWWAIGSGAVLVAGGATAGGFAVTNRSDPAPAHVRAEVATKSAAAVSAQEARARLLAGLAISPAPGTLGVALDAPVSVKAASGLLTAVKVVSSSGAALAGTQPPGSNTWSESAPLEPSTTYTVTAKLAAFGITAERTATFTTLTPVEEVSASVFPTTGMSVGVGQPVVVRFNHDVTTAAAQKAVESHFSVAESQPVPGGWYWFSPHEMHFRPQSFWPAHEQIRVTGDLAGWDAGQGRWGTGQVSETFGIGDARISYANLQTHHMTVTLNGATVAEYPISGGSDKWPTMDGDHIVMDRESVVHMVSSTVGIPVNSPAGYDEYVYDDVHISDSGEYVHAAPWSVGAQGNTNVSHGCINLSPANASSFFDFSRVGDVVEVAGSPRPPVPGDHGVMDWSTPWSQWAPGTVVPLNPPPASTGSAASTTTAATTAPAAG